MLTGDSTARDISDSYFTWRSPPSTQGGSGATELWTGKQEAKDDDPGDLDELIMSGQADINKIQALTAQFAKRHNWANYGLGMLRKSSGISETARIKKRATLNTKARRKPMLCKNGKKMSHTVTQNKYWKHIDQLVTAKVLEEAKGNANGIQYAISYFTVEKGNTGLLRVVINARMVNADADKAPKLRILCPRLLIRLIHSLGEKVHAFSADFRHWFYQIPIDKGDRRLFGIEIHKRRRAPPGTRNSFYRMRVLPMGFSWSPLIAQVVATLVALPIKPKGWSLVDPRIGDAPFHAEGAATVAKMSDEDKKKERNCTPPPYWIMRDDVTGETAGYIVVYYDNVLYLTKSHEDRAYLKQCFNNQTERFNVVVKEAPTEHGAPDQGPLEFLGMAITVPWVDDEDNVTELSWCHLEKNITKWRPFANTATYERLRHIGGGSGIMVWDKIVSGQPMGEMFAQLQPLRKAGRVAYAVAKQAEAEAKAKRARDGLPQDETFNLPPVEWDVRLDSLDSITAHDIETVRAAVEVVCANPTYRPLGAFVKNTKVCLIASDASNKKWGAMILASDGTAMWWTAGDNYGEGRGPCAGAAWTDTIIAHREMEAAEQSLIAACAFAERKQHEKWIMVAAIDNTTAAGALRHGNSADQYLANRGAYWRKRIEEQGHELLVVTVRSEDEAADQISRDEAQDEETNRRCASIMMDAAMVFTMGKAVRMEAQEWVPE